MKHQIIRIVFFAMLASTNALAADTVSDEAALIRAIARANTDSSINKIVFSKNAQISLTSPVIYTGKQNLILQGNGATLDGTNAGSFVLDNELLAHTNDATLVFNTRGNISISELSIINSATRGLLIKIPVDAQGKDIQVFLDKVDIKGSALYGLHIDDNEDEFDDGEIGSAIGIELTILHSSFTHNGIGAIDFDGIRVDERGQGGIYARIIKTHIDGNGADGLELDEAGAGNVGAVLKHVTFNDNGYYNKDDLDDGFDIDEGGAGDVEVSLLEVLVNRNQDEGLDFDEADAGNVKVTMRRVIVMDTKNEGIKIDEQGAGNIDAEFFRVTAMNGNDDGIQITEQGKGRIKARLNSVSATDNDKYGVKIEQWDIKGEDASIEEAGELKIKELTLSGNGQGDELELHNVIAE